MIEIKIKEKTPTFLVEVLSDKLITDANWHRTALSGENFFILDKQSFYPEINTIMNRKKFLKDLYYKNEEGELTKIRDKNDFGLLLNSKTIAGQTTIECALLGSTMKDLGQVYEA